MIENNNKIIQVYPQPNKYDIVHGHFFDRDKLNGLNRNVILYKNFAHYMLVIGSFKVEDGVRIIVVLGTSVKRELYDYYEQKNDLIIKNDIKQAGLKTETLFSINYGTIGMIECNSEYLVIPDYKDSPIVGSLSESDIKRYRHRLNIFPQIENIAKKIIVDNTQMLSNKYYNDLDYILPLTKISKKH